MSASRAVSLPCDSSHWPDVKKILLAAKTASSSGSLVACLQNAFNVIHGLTTSCSESSADVGARPKTRCVFSWLKSFLDIHVSDEECSEYIKHVIPYIIDQAVHIEHIQSSGELQKSRKHEMSQHDLSRQCASSLMACAFLCLFDKNAHYDHAINFNELLTNLDSSQQCYLLRCVLQCFSAGMHLPGGSLPGNITFHRQVLSIPLTAEELLKRSSVLCPFIVDSSHTLQQQQSDQFLQIFVGSITDAVVFPELLVNFLFAEPLDDDELLTVDSCEQLYCCAAVAASNVGKDSAATLPGGESTASRHTESVTPAQFKAKDAGMTESGIGSEAVGGLAGGAKVSWDASVDRKDPTTGTRLCIVSSLATPVDRTPSSAVYDKDCVLAETVRLVCVLEQQQVLSTGYSRWRHHAQPAESGGAFIKSATGDTSETDGPADTSSDSTDHSNPHHPRFRKAAFTGSKTKTWRSTSSAGSFSASMSRGLSFELESSSTSSTADEVPPVAALPRRRSSALHGIASSRRGSTLQYQSSTASESSSSELGAFGRRRSSGMSDISLRSNSSGKRSSADFSSEVEEYFDNLQYRSLKTAVIEEETGTAGLPETLSGLDVEPVPGTSGACGGESTTWKGGIRQSSQQSTELQRDPGSLQVPPRSRGHDRSEGEGRGHRQSVGHCHGQDLLEHFVDNLINEAAQESKIEIESWSTSRNGVTTKAKPTPENTLQVSTHQNTETSLDSGGTAVDRCDEADQRELALLDRFATNVAAAIMSSVFDRLAASSVDQDQTHYAWVQNTEAEGERLEDDLDRFVSSFIEGVFADAITVFRSHSSSASTDTLPTGGTGINPHPASLQQQQQMIAVKPRRVTRQTSDFGPTTTSNARPTQCVKRQRTLSGFKDAVLSEFEDELLVSQVATGPRLMTFTDLRRRSSEPAMLSRLSETESSGPVDVSVRCRHATASASLMFTSDIQPLHSTWRQTVAESLFAGGDGESSSAAAAGIVGTDYNAKIDSRAQNIVIDAFVDAFVELANRTTKIPTVEAGTSAVLPTGDELCQSDITTPLQHLMPRRSTTPQSVATQNAPVETVSQFADQLSQSIVRQATWEATEYLVAQQERILSIAVNEQLELAAANFAEQIIEEAVQVVATQQPMRSVVSRLSSEHSLFAADAQLYAVIQWIAASVAGAPEFHFIATSTGNFDATELEQVLSAVNQRAVTAERLLSFVLTWCSFKQDSLTSSSSVPSLFNFLLLHLT